MKKYFIIAVAALAASAACTKNETETPASPIAFQVANYVPQTKAGEVKFDESKTFNTYAWFHPTSGSAQAFMANETIKWQAANKQWSSDRVYFWPKTGYVNFFSYAGTPAPAMTDGSATYTDKTIAITDDAMLASAAYRYSNSDANVYGLQYGTANTDVTGVPTLFHHLLSQVSVIVKFDASSITDAKNKWDLTVNSLALNYDNKGSLTVTFTDPGATGQAWPYTTAGYNWTPSGTYANLPATVTASVGKVQTTVAPDVSTGLTFFDAVSVLPQALTANATIDLNYTLKHYYDGAEQIYETVDLPGIKLTDFTNETISAWNMNYKYTYTITIKPNKTVTFDPAVEPWQEKAAGYTYPND
ncbi:MAG: fimbrillin family protein [Bacteroidales bacterium]|nr:fimbrillin family protein [Bacteroidales bacterium]